MDKSLTGRVALITGGARGQGRSHALALAREGVHVALLDLARPNGAASVPYLLSTPEDLAETSHLVQDLGARCMSMAVDVRDGGAMSAAVKEVVSEFGRVDIVLANAGVFSTSSCEQMSDTTWQDMIDINLTGVFNTFRAVAPHLREQGSGRVVATASMAGRGGYPNLCHYVAAKWGVIGLAKSFAAEMAPFRVTVNVVAPTNVDTDMIQNPAIWQLFSGGGQSRSASAEAMKTMHALGVPWIDPGDVSAAIVYLVSDAARYVTGEVIHIGAGLSVGSAI